MVPLLGYFPIFQQNDQIRIPDRRKTVGNDNRSAVRTESEHGAPDLLLCHCIYRTCSFVQDQDRGIGKHCPGYGQKLPLPLGQLHASMF